MRKIIAGNKIPNILTSTQSAEIMEKNEADFIVTNHYYQKKNPSKMRLFLKKKYRPVYEIKVNNIIINSLYEKRK